MSEKLIIAIVNGFILLTILLTQILMPKYTRRNILLGIKIPEDKMKTDEVNRIIRGFIRENLIVGVPVLILISLLTYYIENVSIFVIGVFLYLGILFVVYLRWNKKVKDLKEEMEWNKLDKKVVVVDTKFSRDRLKVGTVSKKWFLIPLGIIVFNIILSLVMYPYLPDKIPTHWDFSGNVDGWMNKSILVALLIPITQIFMAVVIYLSYYFMMKSKQQIDPKKPEVSLRKNILFRKIWSIFFIVMLTLMEIIFTVSNMMVLGIVENTKIFNIIYFPIILVIILGTLVLGIVVGQGGDRLKLKEDKKENGEYDINDDKLWKLGNTIYYNPDDSSLFIEKRVGIGWTVNAGRPLGMVILVIPFIIIILTLIFIK